ncbi:MAG: D-glycero-beta-D-manno-heptose 1-phosphate adenylyltransferase [Planctomycetota bacterium]|nr:D-glycero-beta-D-manno-heptose 1-phosphate adenylyltransferase [Planctomycetota bacterium]
MNTDLLRVIEELPTPDVLVVGDLILDRYVWGAVERLSAEAPIQVLLQNRCTQNPGGMGAVACNLVRLGARVRCAGVVGADAEGEQLLGGLEEAGVDVSGIVTAERRPTSLKTRFVASSQHSRQQILRVDRETDEALDKGLSAAVVEAVRTRLPEADILVLSDYGKGVVHAGVCEEIIARARSAGVPVLVDPKGLDFMKYRGATAVTPNRSEAAAATGRAIRDYEDAESAARELIESLDLESIYITLDREGIYVLERQGEGAAVETEPREVYDVTGAGDNVIAVLAYALAGGRTPRTAATLANLAGGIAVERVGVVTIGWDQIAGRIAARAGGTAKLLPAEALVRLLESARLADRRVVFTNGCFDVLHAGHVDFLARARALGDLLVVGINDDASITRLKGEGRPVNPIGARAAVLGGLLTVDYLVGFAEDTPGPLIELLRPDVLVKGEDWKDKGVVGREFVESYGGEVVLLPLIPGLSTTSILRRLEEE